MLSNRIVTKLLENQADPNLTNRYGDTALMYAALLSDNTQIIKNLLKHGANPNLKNKNGQTALINAASRGHENVASILLKAGADKNIKDNEGKSFIAYIDRLPRLKTEYLKEVKGAMMDSRRDMPSAIADEIAKFLFKGKKKSVKNKKKSKSKKSVGKKKSKKRSVGKKSKKKSGSKKSKKSIRRVRK
jgi:ankyrin repeat protein